MSAATTHHRPHLWRIAATLPAEDREWARLHLWLDDQPRREAAGELIMLRVTVARLRSQQARDRVRAACRRMQETMRRAEQLHVAVSAACARRSSDRRGR